MSDDLQARIEQIKQEEQAYIDDEFVMQVIEAEESIDSRPQAIAEKVNEGLDNGYNATPQRLCLLQDLIAECHIHGRYFPVQSQKIDWSQIMINPLFLPPDSPLAFESTIHLAGLLQEDAPEPTEERYISTVQQIFSRASAAGVSDDDTFQEFILQTFAASRGTTVEDLTCAALAGITVSNPNLNYVERHSGELKRVREFYISDDVIAFCLYRDGKSDEPRYRRQFLERNKERLVGSANIGSIATFVTIEKKEELKAPGDDERERWYNGMMMMVRGCVSDYEMRLDIIEKQKAVILSQYPADQRGQAEESLQAEEQRLSLTRGKYAYLFNALIDEKEYVMRWYSEPRPEKEAPTSN